MSASFKVEFGGLKKLLSFFTSSPIKEAFRTVARDKAVAALIGQAIGDCFEKEGPGWAPLKAATIRASVSKRLRKRLSALSDKDLLRQESMMRTIDVDPHRKILQRTTLLKKTWTIPDFIGSAKDNKRAKPGAQGHRHGEKTKIVSGSNIYRVQDTNIVWGSSLAYAMVHQRGEPKKNIPARPVKISKEWEDRLYQLVVMKVKKELKTKLRAARV